MGDFIDMNDLNGQNPSFVSSSQEQRCPSRSSVRSVSGLVWNYRQSQADIKKEVNTTPGIFLNNITGNATYSDTERDLIASICGNPNCRPIVVQRGMSGAFVFFALLILFIIIFFIGPRFAFSWFFFAFIFIIFFLIFYFSPLTAPANGVNCCSY